MTGIQKTVKIFAICLAILIIFSIVSSIALVLGLVTDIGIGKDKNSRNFSEVYQDIHNLEIDLVNSNIKIQEGNTWKVTANGVDRTFSVKKRKTTLKIEEKKIWFFNRHHTGEITIYVPRGIINELDIDGGVGKTEIENITAQELDLDSGVGYLKIENSNFSKTTIDGGVGKTEITSSRLNQLDIDGGVGKIDIEAYITGFSRIDCGVGEISVTLLGDKKDYTIQAEKGLGKITIDNQTYSNETTYGNGRNKIEIEGGVGTIDLKFARNTILEDN